MATRRPRVKVAANLSIRRPSKPTGKPAAELKTETVEACEEKPAVEPEAPVTANHDEQPAVASPLHHVAPVQSDEKPEEEKQQFKLPSELRCCRFVRSYP